MTRQRILGLALASAVVLAVVAGSPAGADGVTSCAFGGPAGTSRLIELQVPAESFLNLSLSGGRATRPADTATSWHLAQAVFVMDSAGEPVAHRLSSSGSNTRRVVAGDQRLDAAGADLPFARNALFLPPVLEPGTYYIAAFGSDGSAEGPNDRWGGHVEVAAGASCRAIGSGRIVDVNHTDFEGGNQVSAPGVASVDGATYQTTFSEERVVGFVDASVQVVGTAEVDYLTPAGGGTVEDELVAFSSPGGAFAWTARLSGVAPLASVVAMGFDLP